MSETHNIDKIIFQYMSGEANLEEIQELRKWLNSDPNNRDVFENIVKFWKGSKIEIQTENGDQVFSQLLARINNNQRRNSKFIYSYPSSRNNGWKKFRRFAAVIVLLVTSILVIKLGADVNTNESITREGTIVNKQNPLGQKSTIKLPDGSTVWLNSGSSISYPEYFDGNERKIVLKGEAFFDVIRDERRPFIVEMGDMSVSVLGTRFNVRAFPKEEVANVSLVSGKVKVKKYDGEYRYESFFLEPGEEIKYNGQSGEIVKQKFDVENVTAWKDGILILHNDSFATFTEKLERWYGVEVIVEGKPNDNFIVTGKFHQENMENVLRALQFSRDFEFTIEDKLLTIKFRDM